MTQSSPRQGATPRLRSISSAARRRAAMLGLLVVAVLGVAPAAASASDMSIRVESTVVEEDAQHPYSVSGTADEDAAAFVKIYADEGKGCPEDSGTASFINDSRITPDSAQLVRGPFQYSGTYYLGAAGSYLLCGYLKKSQENVTLTTATLAFRVVSDTDGDGFRDDQDPCPTGRGVDERTNQPTSDGCPIRDGDRDGVRNEEDRCPTEPGFDSRTNQRTADGCPVRDSDSDGVVDSADACPTQFGRDPQTNQPTANGCTPPDTDGDRIPDARDRCPLESSESGSADPALPGCLMPKFVVYLGDSFERFTGRKKLGKPLFNILTSGAPRATAFEITVTLSAVSAREAKLKQREIASTEGVIPAKGTGFFNVFERPTASAATRKKLRRLRTVSFKYVFTVKLADGSTRQKTESHTLKSGKVVDPVRAVYGSGTNAAGETH